MTTALPDFPDWTTPVSVIESDSADLLAGAGLVVGSDSAEIDTSAYQSIAVRVALPPSAAGSQYVLQAQWTTGPLPSDSQSVSFHSAASYALSADTLYWQLPVRGVSVMFTLFGSVAGNVTATVFGSTRTIADAAVSLGGDVVGKLICDTGSIAVPAGGTSAVFYIPPVTRAINLKMNGTGTEAMHCNLDGVSDLAAALAAYNFARFNGTAPNLTVNDLAVAGTGLQVTMSNDGAAAHNLRVLAWDVS